MTHRFEDLPLGALFHFASLDGFFVKIDANRARAQVGGALVDAAPGAIVRAFAL